MVQDAPSPVRRIFDQAFNQGNFAIVDELVSVNATSHMASWGLPANRLGLKQLIASFRTAFPDLHCAVEDEIGEGDRFAAHWRLRGTHRGMFFGNPPTGKVIEAIGIIFIRIENGWIVEDWILVDQIGILQQIGVVPPTRAGF